MGRMIRIAVASCAAAGIMSTGTAYLASNTVPPSGAGEGAGKVTVTTTVAGSGQAYQVSTPGFDLP